MADRLPVTASELVSVSPADPGAPHLVLWNTEAYFALRPGQLATRIGIDHHDPTGRLVGSFVVGEDPDTGSFVCGAGAPFGGPDLVRRVETLANVEGLVDHALRALDARSTHGPASIEVRAKPGHHGPNEAGIVFALCNRGFEVAACEINAFLDLRGLSSVSGYVEALKPAARKVLRRASAQELTVAQIAADDEPAWAEAYEVLRRNRIDRGRPMRLPLDYVQTIRDAFPGRVRLLVVEHEDRIVAAALLYRVSPERDVVQYWGDAHHELAHSPMNVLVASVVEHALASGTATLDIGISSEDGVANHGLVQFKRAVGCSIEPRFVFRRSEPGSA